MRIFVTGAAGFIGSHFLRAALAAGHDVTALRMPGTNPVVPVETFPSASSSSPPSRGPAWIESTLDQVTSDQLAGHHTLVHFAAYGVSPQPCTWEKAFKINVSDSLAIMERAIEAGIQKIVVCGSCVEYGQSAERYKNVPPDAPLEPIGPYAGSKAALSVAVAALCREKKIEMAILRLFTVFGEGQHAKNFWPSLKKAAFAGEDFPMSSGEQIRDFISVEDAAQVFLNICNDRHSTLGTPVVVNVGTGKPQSLRSFAEHWWNKWEATGRLLPGALPYRLNEVMRYVPKISDQL